MVRVYLRLSKFVAVAAILFAVVLVPAWSGELLVQVDFARTNGTIRPLHGINRGPLVAGGMIDLTEAQRALNIPFTRLHDSHWPNSDVVDVHAVFPDAARDPEKAESYDFARTDAYIAAIQKTGAQIVFRLGESIEHDAPKRFVHPPRDAEKWARICLGIIRHYNEGWANGFHHGIRYWEIWNEPENRPVMWTGTDEQFLALYATAAREIKRQFPSVKVGGPGFGYTGEIIGGNFRAGGLLTNFLSRSQRDSLPLDFLSWHCYTDDPRELVLRAKGIRRLLDTHGFTNTESHLNEWNFLPDRSWTAISKTKSTPESRRRAYGEMAGPSGAAFVAAALIELQDAPVDVANIFHGETGPFGLFDVNGVPEKNYFALRAFTETFKTPRRVEAQCSAPMPVLAGLDAANSQAQVLIANLVQPQAEVRVTLTNLSWRVGTRCEVRVVDAAHSFDAVTDARLEGDTVRFTLRRPAVALVSLKPEK